MYNNPGYFPGNPGQSVQNNGYLGFSPNHYSSVPQQSMVKGRPVSNEEEANAAMIDFDGSIFVFPDNAHGKIYTKQLGMDGNIIFCRYSLDTQPTMKSQNNVTQSLDEYVTKEEMNHRMEDLKTFMVQKLDQITDPKGGSTK